MLNALADQAAIAIERITLAGAVDQARLLAETEKLRGALLTSISHDLRTPLATILGSVTALRSFGERYDAAARDEVLGSVQTEAERLNRFVGNLLDMMRLEAGSLAPKRELLDLAEAVGTALRRTAALLVHHSVETRLPDDLPMVQLDHVLFEQVLVNLLDNAAKYAPQGSLIRIEAAETPEGGIVLTVADHGPGIPPDRRQSVFDRFYRLDVNDSSPAGTGLGLAICRGFVDAMGGRIHVEDAPGGGAAFVISLPETLIHVEPLRD
ncbi:sensor histidine kinase [Elstera litoralis]|uniref:sensor histidine kinase n=1 Tax=Elstera litoralis TaxID=552518 RepID=UPI001E40A4FA|nr:ATP-binding protein [Elstera litoralis]